LHLNQKYNNKNTIFVQNTQKCAKHYNRHKGALSQQGVRRAKTGLLRALVEVVLRRTLEANEDNGHDGQPRDRAQEVKRNSKSLSRRVSECLP
jgi:hypothetical protein